MPSRALGLVHPAKIYRSVYFSKSRNHGGIFRGVHKTAGGNFRKPFLMKSVTITALFLLLYTYGAYAQTQYKIDYAPTSGTSAGLVYNQTTPETFTYHGKVLNDYGWGFHNYVESGTAYLSAYMSGFHGMDFFYFGSTAGKDTSTRRALDLRGHVCKCHQ